eukprot:106080_1
MPGHLLDPANGQGDPGYDSAWHVLILSPIVLVLMLIMGVILWLDVKVNCHDGWIVLDPSLDPETLPLYFASWLKDTDKVAGPSFDDFTIGLRIDGIADAQLSNIYTGNLLNIGASGDTDERGSHLKGNGHPDSQVQLGYIGTDNYGKVVINSASVEVADGLFMRSNKDAGSSIQSVKEPDVKQLSVIFDVVNEGLASEATAKFVCVGSDEDVKESDSDYYVAADARIETDSEEYNWSETEEEGRDYDPKEDEEQGIADAGKDLFEGSSAETESEQEKALEDEEATDDVLQDAFKTFEEVLHAARVMAKAD